jgi:formylglycine-generating enzyme required for sulfatase activity
MGGDAGLMGGSSASHQTSYPIHEVTIDPFWMDATEVTNRQFAEFVEATGYVTFAERPLPEALVEQLKRAAGDALAQLEPALQRSEGAEREAIRAQIAKIHASSQFDQAAGSIVFNAPKDPLYDERDYTQWWRLEPKANWRRPDGGDTSWKDRLDHPVVNLNREDAAAYAAWAGKRLPTEAEWERAARGGLEKKPFVWGDVFQPDGEGSYRANTWQGVWPFDNSGADGFVTTAPVKSFPPNNYGLYDMAGNVWEITADLYHPQTYRMRGENPVNPRGPDPRLLAAYGWPAGIHVTRGGSFLCNDNWCSGYQPGSRQSVQADSPAYHTGFRCVIDVEESPAESN